MSIYRGSANKKGFTLMELLIVMLIAAFSMTAIYAGFKFFSISMKRAFMNTLITKELHNTLEYITKDLSWAECLATDYAGSFHKSNSSDVLAFRIPGITTVGDSIKDCYDYVYIYTKQNGVNKDVYYALIPNVEGSGSTRDQIEVDSRKIAEGISQIEFTSDGATPLVDDGTTSAKDALKALYTIQIRITYRLLNVLGQYDDCNLFGYVKLRNHPHYLM